MDAITKELIVVSNDTYINSESIIQLLYQLVGKTPNTSIPVTLIMDNARYQKCQVVQEAAEILDIDLVFLPPYSPNLNLIERLWKFVKNSCLYSKYYNNFIAFKRAISDCLDKINSECNDEIQSLLALNFQIFKKSQIMP